MTPWGPVEVRALRSVALQFWMNGLVFASFVPRLPEIRDRLGVDLSQLGLLLTLGSLGGLIGSALCGRAIDRFGTRLTMTGGALGSLLCLPLIGYATGPLAFVGVLIALQLFDVVADVAMNMQASRLSALRPVPVINRMHGLWSVGSLLGGFGASLVADAVSLQVHLLAVALVLLATTGYVAPGLLRDDQAPTRIVGSSSTSGMGDPELSEQPGARRPLRGVALLFGALAFATFAMEMVPMEWAAIRLAEDFGLAASRAGLGFVATATGMVVGRFGGDSVMARTTSQRLLRLATAIAMLGTALATLSPEPWLSLFGFFLAGLGVSVLFPRLYDEAAQAPGRPGAVLGAMTAGIRVGLLVIPSAVGAMAESQALDVGQAMALVALPAGTLLLLAGRRTPRS